MFSRRPFMLMAPDGASGSGGTGGSGSSNQTGGQSSGTDGSSNTRTAGNNQEGDQSDAGQKTDFESWFKSQPKDVQTVIEDHTSGLRSALISEREGRKKLEGEVRSLASKAEKGSDLEQQLAKVADQIAEGDRKVTFFEEAHKSGVTNLKLAYTVAVQEELFDRRGLIDWARFRKEYPELFGRVQGTGQRVNATAGDGTGQSGKPTSGGMNAFIRTSAGRGG